MAGEAMAAGVPIIFPKSDMGFGGLEDPMRIADSELVVDPASYASFSQTKEASIYNLRFPNQTTNEDSEIAKGADSLPHAIV